MSTTDTLYTTLADLNIDYDEVAHEAVTTVEAAQFVTTLIGGVGVKNLFLTSARGAYVLVMLAQDARADLKALARIADSGRLSFANAEQLHDVLDLEPGSVTPLAVINDEDGDVTVLIDRSLEGARLLMHPLTNTKTVAIDYADLIRFLEATDHTPILF